MNLTNLHVSKTMTTKKGLAKFIYLTAALGTGMIFMPWTSPALAHDVRYDGPYGCGTLELQTCGYGQVRDNHEIVDACDIRRDGNGFAVVYRLRNGQKGVVNDGNGSKEGCGIQRVGSPSNPVVKFTVCKNWSETLLCKPEIDA